MYKFSTLGSLLRACGTSAGCHALLWLAVCHPEARQDCSGGGLPVARQPHTTVHAAAGSTA